MTDTSVYPLVTGKGWRALRLHYTAGSDSPSSSSGTDSEAVAPGSGSPSSSAAGSSAPGPGSGAGASNLAMDVILPDSVVSPADLPASTWGEATAALTTATAEQQVALKLPKLDLASGVMDLFPVLTAMGVELGSLDHIAEDIDANQAAQQVRLIVDEEGTVAAALTEIGVVAAAAPDSSSPVEFTVDHPYVLRIVDLTSGVAIIEAAILNPAG